MQFPRVAFVLDTILTGIGRFIIINDRKIICGNCWCTPPHILTQTPPLVRFSYFHDNTFCSNPWSASANGNPSQRRKRWSGLARNSSRPSLNNYYVGRFCSASWNRDTRRFYCWVPFPIKRLLWRWLRVLMVYPCEYGFGFESFLQALADFCQQLYGDVVHRFPVELSWTWFTNTRGRNYSDKRMFLTSKETICTCW